MFNKHKQNVGNLNLAPILGKDLVNAYIVDEI